MRLFRQEHLFHSNWDTVTAALWVKYPNALQPHVIRVDTLDREIDSIQQRYRCLRLLTLHYHIPSWISTLLRKPSTKGYGLEEAVCDLKTKTLQLKSKNVTFSRFLQIHETCIYKPNPSDPDQSTIYTQEAEYRIVGLGYYVSSVLEGAVVQSAAEKAKCGLDAMQLRIERLEKESRKRADRVLQTFEQNVHTLENKILEKKERLDKSIIDAKQHLEKTRLYIEACVNTFKKKNPIIFDYSKTINRTTQTDDPSKITDLSKKDSKGPTN